MIKIGNKEYGFRRTNLTALRISQLGNFEGWGDYARLVAFAWALLDTQEKVTLEQVANAIDPDDADQLQAVAEAVSTAVESKPSPI